MKSNCALKSHWVSKFGLIIVLVLNTCLVETVVERKLLKQCTLSGLSWVFKKSSPCGQSVINHTILNLHNPTLIFLQFSKNNMEQNEFYQLIGCWKENCLGFLLMCCIFNENRYCGRYATCILWTFILNSMYCKLSFRIFSDAQEFKERLVMRLAIWRSQSRLPVTVCHQERAFLRFCTTQELQSKSTKVRP